MNPADLENLLNYKFRSPELLELALTHRSWAYEKLRGKDIGKVRGAENESLEFVGDSVLGLAIAEELYRQHTDAAEGDLTLMKHRLVSAPTLARIAQRLSLGEHLRIGRGEEMSGGREKSAILADTLEAVIGAVFFDSGYVAARAVILTIFSEELSSVTPQGSGDHKSSLQEILQARRLAAPVYNLLNSEGQPHDRTFYVEAVWDGGRADGEGRTIKAAEMMAASRALELLQNDRD